MYYFLKLFISHPHTWYTNVMIMMICQSYAKKKSCLGSIDCCCLTLTFVCYSFPIFMWVLFFSSIPTYTHTQFFQRYNHLKTTKLWRLWKSFKTVLFLIAFLLSLIPSPLLAHSFTLFLLLCWCTLCRIILYKLVMKMCNNVLKVLLNK